MTQDRPDTTDWPPEDIPPPPAPEMFDVVVDRPLMPKWYGEVTDVIIHSTGALILIHKYTKKRVFMAPDTWTTVESVPA